MSTLTECRPSCVEIMIAFVRLFVVVVVVVVVVGGGGGGVAAAAFAVVVQRIWCSFTGYALNRF